VGLAARRRIDRPDGHFDDRKPCGNRSKNDFRFEPIPIGSSRKGERFDDGVTSKAALRVAQRSARKRGEKEVRNPVAEAVARRRAVPYEIPHSKHERTRVFASPKDGERRLRRVLAVGVYGHGHAHCAPGSFREPRSKCRSFAAIVRVAHDDCAAGPGHFLRRIARAVVHHDDGNTEPNAKGLHDTRHRRCGVERWDDRARAGHGVALHYPAMPVRLVVQEGPHEGVSGLELRRRARMMLDALEVGDAELSVVLTGDATIQELNRAYRGKNRPTDVLAFAQREGPLGHLAGQLLGDVILSVPTARRQARAHRRNLLSELTMLLAHGVLHLLGWDHDTPATDQRMRRETARLCAASARASRERKPATRPR
jgi:probable rRNA maturation factor